MAITLGNVDTYARSYLRNGGSDSSAYTSGQIGFAFQTAAEEVIRECFLLPKIGTITLANGVNDLPSMPTGFRPDRLMKAYLSSTNARISMPYLDPNSPYYTEGAPAFSDLSPTSISLMVVSTAYLLDLRAGAPQVGQPTMIAFDQISGTGMCFPTPDQDYTATLQWNDQLTNFTPGTSSAGTTFNLQDDYLRPIITYGVASIVQGNEPQNQFAQNAKAQFEKYIEDTKNRMSLGTQMVSVMGTGGGVGTPWRW